MSKEDAKKQKSPAMKVLSAFGDVLLILFLIFAVTMAVMSIISSKNQIPSLFGKAIFSVQSDSMVPTFNKGDMIIGNVNFNSEELQVGDVVTFWAKDEDTGVRFLNTHRITEIELEDGEYIIKTKGDNNPIEDEDPHAVSDTNRNEIVARWNPVGKDKGIRIKGLGKVLDFLQSQKGILICFVIPLAIFFIFALYKFILALVRFKEKDKTPEDKEAIEKAAIERYIREHGGTLPDQQNTDQSNTENSPSENAGEQDAPVEDVPAESKPDEQQ